MMVIIVMVGTAVMTIMVNDSSVTVSAIQTSITMMLTAGMVTTAVVVIIVHGVYTISTVSRNVAGDDNARTCENNANLKKKIYLTIYYCVVCGQNRTNLVHHHWYLLICIILHSCLVE